MSVQDRYDAYGCRIIDEYNFFQSTECIWYLLDADSFTHVIERYPSYESPHGNSQYWYTEDGVYRLSNHWGANIRSCDWYLDAFPEDIETHKDSLQFYHEHEFDVPNQLFLGFARWEDFADIA